MRGEAVEDETEAPQEVTCSGSVRLPQLSAQPQAEEEENGDGN